MTSEKEHIKTFDERFTEYGERAERKYNHYHEMMETPDVPLWIDLTLDLQERWINLVISEDNFDKEG